jgi:hypothetical protein
VAKQTLELLYDVDVKACLDDLRRTGIIESQAIDSPVNKNRWQVPQAWKTSTTLKH